MSNTNDHIAISCCRSCALITSILGHLTRSMTLKMWRQFSVTHSHSQVKRETEPNRVRFLTSHIGPISHSLSRAREGRLTKLLARLAARAPSRTSAPHQASQASVLCEITTVLEIGWVILSSCTVLWKSFLLRDRTPPGAGISQSGRLLLFLERTLLHSSTRVTRAWQHLNGVLYVRMFKRSQSASGSRVFTSLVCFD